MEAKSRDVSKRSGANGRIPGANGVPHELENVHKAIFDETGEAIFILDPANSEILEANKTAAHLSGYPSSRLRGLHLNRFIQANGHSLPKDAFSKNRAAASVTVFRVKNGGAIPIEIKTNVVSQPNKSLQLVFVRQIDRQNDALPSKKRRRALKRSPRSTSGEAAERLYDFPNIIGRSRQIRETCQRIGQVATTDCTVLIQGESGAGKEIIAQAIHYHSMRAEGPFVKVNCAALPEALLESELFGHVKGAFTGAMRDRRGRFQQADHGTILLDEINSMTLAGQAKFLRVLQDHEFQRVGSSSAVAVDVRVIVASNVDLQQAVSNGAFREDLYYRLNVFPIFIAPLREKKEDAPLLARHFLKKYNVAVGKDIQGFAPEATALMMQHDWPGNVRELKNAVEYAVIVGKTELIQPSDLPSNLTLGGKPVESAQMISGLGLRKRLNLLEKEIIVEALKRAHGVKKIAAKILQIDPRNLPYLLKKHHFADAEN